MSASRASEASNVLNLSLVMQLCPVVQRDYFDFVDFRVFLKFERL